MPRQITVPSHETTFFSNQFSVSLKFLRDGSIRGKLIYAPDALKIIRHFNGLCSLKKNNLEIVFFIEWPNDNLDMTVLTCFAGKIFNYEENVKCLILKWLHVKESITTSRLNTSRDFDVLFDSADTDINKDLGQIASNISKHIFD